MPHITPAYISIGCNRFSSVCAHTARGTVAFGAGKLIALWDTADASKRGVYETIPGHGALVSCLKGVTLSNGQDVLVSGDQGGTVNVWVPSPRSTTTTLGPTPAYTLAHSEAAHPAAAASISALGLHPTPDGGALILTGGSDAVVHVWKWSPSSGLVRLQSLQLGGRLPLDITLHALPASNALIMALATTDKSIHIYTCPAPGEVFTRALGLEGHEDWVRCVEFTRFPRVEVEAGAEGEGDGEGEGDLMLASGSQDGYIRLWRLTRLSPSHSAATAAAAAPQEAQQGELDQDMLDEFERRMTGETHGSSLSAAAAAGAGAGKLSTKAHVVSVPSAEYGINLEALLIGHEGWVTNLHWSPPRSSASASASAPPPPRLVSTAADNSAIIWAPEPRSSIWLAQHRFGEIGGKGVGLFGALWAGGGVVANAWGGGFHRWCAAEEGEGETEQWEAEVAPTGHGAGVKDLAWDPAQEWLVSVSTDQTSRIHAPWTRPAPDGGQLTTWGEVNRPQIHGYDMTCVAPISRLRFVSGADEKVVRVFDAPRGFARSLVHLGVTDDEGLEDEATSVGASVPPLGLSNRALSKPVEADPSQDRGFNQEHISISDTLDTLPTEGVLSSSTLWPEIEKLYGHGYELMAVASSPSGDMIATSCKATSAEHAVIRLYDTATWQQIHPPLAGHTLTITRIVFSPDGQFILSCSRDRTWRLFRKKEGELGFEPVAAEKPHARIIWDCTFSPDSSYFVTAARDKQFKVWRKASPAGDKWELAATVKGTEAATAVSITSDEGKQRDLLAVGYEDGTIQIHAVNVNATRVELLFTIPQSYAHVDQINRLAWRRSKGRLELASCSEDRSVKVLDIRL